MVGLKTIRNYFLKPALVLLTLFILLKLLFLSVNFNDIKEATLDNILGVFTHSFSIDIAVISYILLIPLLVFIIQLFVKRPILHHFCVAYYSFVSVLSIILYIIDSKLYSYWNSKLSAKALFFLNTPFMTVKTTGKWSVLAMLVLIITLSYLVILYFTNCTKKQDFKSIKWQTGLPLSFILLGLCVLGLRGGLREIPINQSDAYFSSENVLNVAGVNSLWNFGNVLFQNVHSLTTNPYKVMDESRAKAIVEKMYEQKNNTLIPILNQKRPNIVFIVLEGVNANCIYEYNEKFNLMPTMSGFIEEGYTFKKMYSSGMRTDQGLVSILSGFPAMPFHSIGAQPEKFQYLPSLAVALKKHGYKSKFFFGGEPEFGSIKAYLTFNGFEKIYSFKDFPKAQLMQELGVPDEFLFEKFIHDTQHEKEPFFNMILTQTTHEPFDMPFNDNVNNIAKKYSNTVEYVDSLLGDFYTKCKTMPWYMNTLFIVTSDHAHKQPDNYWYNAPERFNIPFILFGEVLNDSFKGKTSLKLVSQTDIPLSLSKQLGLPYKHYQFSKDIFDIYSPDFSSYTHIHGNNLILPNQFCSVNYEVPNNFVQEKDSCLLKNGAYFQYVFENYMNY